MKKLLFAALCLMPFSASAAGLNTQFLSASATAITDGGTVLGLWIVPGSSAGTIQMREADLKVAPVTSGAPVRDTFNTSALSAGGGYMMNFPTPGLEYRGGLYITLTSVGSVTVIYK